jgi:hypothetical protein
MGSPTVRTFGEAISAASAAGSRAGTASHGRCALLGRRWRVRGGVVGAEAEANVGFVEAAASSSFAGTIGRRGHQELEREVTHE